MKFAPVTLAIAATIAAGSLSVPSYSVAQDYHSYEDYCRHKKKEGQRTGAILGAIGGAIIGSNMAAHSGGRAGGAVLGAGAGAVVGSNIGLQSAKCKNGHAYWTMDETYDYRDPHYYHHMDGRYDDDWYYRHHCRWARDYNGGYVRVCPGPGGYVVEY